MPIKRNNSPKKAVHDKHGREVHLDEKERMLFRIGLEQGTFVPQDVQNYLNLKVEGTIDIFNFMEKRKITPEQFSTLELEAQRRIEALAAEPKQKTVKHPASLEERTETRHLPDSTRYDFKEKLGEGGMGAVYKAWDKRLGRNVAIKIMRKEVAGTATTTAEENMKRFLREARSIASLDHPNIINVYDVGEIAGNPYYAMKLIDGAQDFRKLILGLRYKKTHYPEKELLRMFASFCNAMAYVHQHGYVHRDVKPANIMLDKFGQVYVADFGLAKKIRDEKGNKIEAPDPAMSTPMRPDDDQDTHLSTLHLTLEGIVMGSPHQMPVEQLFGMDLVDERSDLYAAGTILYELMVPEKEFRTGEAIEELIPLIRGNVFVKPRAIKPKLPKEIESIILKTLAKDPEDRYQRFEELRDDIKRYLDGENVRVHDYGFAESWVKRFQRNPKKALGSGIAALAIFGIASVYGVMSGEVARSNLHASEQGRKAAEATAKAKSESEAKARAEANASNESRLRLEEKSKRETAELEGKLKDAQLALAAEREKGQNVAQNIIADGDRLIKDKGDLKGAIEKYTEAIEKSRGRWNEPYFKRGLAKYSRMLATSAIEDFIEANKVSEEITKVPDIRALFYAGWTNLDLIERLNETKQKQYPFPPGKEFFKKLIDTAPDKEAGYVMLARSLVAFAEERFDDAYQLALETESKNPRMVEAKCVLAQYGMESINNPFNHPAMRKHRNYKREFERIEDALELDKDQIRCLILKPQLLLALGIFDEAKADCEKLIRIRPDIPHFHYFKAIAHQHANEADKCIDELIIAEKLDTPIHNAGASLRSEILTLRGLVRIAKKEYDLAEEDLTDALENREWAQGYSYRGVVRAERPNPDFEAAMNDHNKAIALNPDLGQAYCNRGRCYEKMDKTDNALADYKMSVKKEYAFGLVQLGSLYYRLGKKTEAIDAFETYLKNPNNKQQRSIAEQFLNRIRNEKK